MKRRGLKSCLFIFSLFTLTTIGVNATETPTKTSSTDDVKTEFKINNSEETISTDTKEILDAKIESNIESKDINNSKQIENTTVKEKNSINNEEDLQSLYDYGIEKGIIDTDKYPFDAFVKNDEMYFKNLFAEYNKISGIEKISYKEWLVLNNYGIMPDTKESVYDLKIQPRDTAANKRKFCATVKKGDILISSKNTVTGLIGHAAIMTTDNLVLEMPGGPTSKWKSNNRQISKDKWFNEHAKHWTSVYRCKDSSVAVKAANWVDRNYYNPNGGSKKTISIDYGITNYFPSTNPSYCSKLVLHAYWYGSGNLPVINDMFTFATVVPTNIPNYFTPSYSLQYKGKF